MSCLLLLLVSGCGPTTQANGDKVKLLITPVATPTATQAAQPTAAPVTYTVKPGDTLSGIADLFGVTVDDIVRVNNIADPNSLAEGQMLKIPGRSPEGTPTEQASGTQTPGGPASPILPPPNVTPPQGPTTTQPTPGAK